MNNKYFSEVRAAIPFEGKDSKNPLAFKYYNKDQKVGGKAMAEHLRFSVAYWHTMMGKGADIFGGPGFERDWHKASDPIQRAKDTMDAAFEFFQKLGVEYYCFHDRDIAPEGDTFSKSCKNLEVLVEYAKKWQKETGIKLLWGTANLFGSAIYAQGAGTNPNAHVMATAAAQIKNAIDATYELGGENYVFWGGREGYETLINTDMKKEQEQMARFLKMAVDYKKKIGFKGQFLIEPKPAEPMKHQYDSDAATTLNFLRAYDLINDFKLNIEANHATLAGNTFEHELAVASIAGKLGSVDANRGDLLLGWDTDQFPNSIYEITLAMMVILNQNGLGSGGLNFDAKVRRSSSDPVDLFYAHIGGMDTFARGLMIAHKMIKDKALSSFIEERYSSFKSGIGADIMSGKVGLEEVEKWVLKAGNPVLKSGRQEMLENIINSYLY
ncbi:MAG: xylose isomerase [Calditrichaceae bacterium]|nr:xylose isomerase [Calditrichaceae bacterium]MBN2708348.1 xylose isomerase [Calditrichaceae bacterium]RQV96585.1 MAG: xylose isomerase [Calditrichota bacterium]